MRRARKLLITCLVIGAAVLLIAWNTTAQTSRTALGVSDAKRDAANLEGREIALKGTVVAGSIVLNQSRIESFDVMDSQERLHVLYGLAPPENFGPKDVVVNGFLNRTADGGIVFQAHSIQVGCSSKY